MLIEAIGGPGTLLSWTFAGAAPANALSNAGYVYSASIPVGSCEQLGIAVQVQTTGAGAPTASMRLRWSPDGSNFFDEILEVAGVAVAGPPPVQPFSCSIKEWGPLPSAVAPAFGNPAPQIPRPAISHFVRVGILWSAAPAAGDLVNVWIERQAGGQLQGAN